MTTNIQTNTNTTNTTNANEIAAPKVKWFYNGLKVDGGKLIKCFFSASPRTDGKKGYTVYTKGYSTSIPRNIGVSVKNNTDLMTDYFESDSIFIPESHPFYNEIKTALDKRKNSQASKN